MSNDCLKSLAVGTGQAARPIAIRQRPGGAPGLFWLGGVKSDMKGTKAPALDTCCDGPQVVIGSSMGGWMALLLVRELARRVSPATAKIAALVLIAPAV